MSFSENATVFAHDAPPREIAAARERGESVVVLPAPVLPEPVDTPGTTNLTWDQAVEMYKRYGIAYRAVADGSKGGHTPGRKYGTGRLAPTVSTKKR